MSFENVGEIVIPTEERNFVLNAESPKITNKGRGKEMKTPGVGEKEFEQKPTVQKTVKSNQNVVAKEVFCSRNEKGSSTDKITT